jgi:putative MATE family efflux protein
MKQDKKSAQDMGSGSVKKLLVSLAVPAVVAQVINLLYNIVDRIYIGHIPEIGASALTGVGLFVPILLLLNAFAMLAGSGGAPRAAIAMGLGNKNKAEKIVANCFTVLLGSAVVLTVIFYITAPTLLKFFGASDVTLPYAVSYARIYILGGIFVLLVLGMNPFITTQGFAKISMLTTVIGAVINIILDPIFIFLLGMGVQGAAIATVFSQAVSAIWILRFLTGTKTNLKLKKENMKLEAQIILPCLALGISTFVMISTESLLSISFTSSLARYGGDLAVGAMTIITSVSQLVSMPVQGICQGGQPIISFNFGAGKNNRVREAFRTQFAACVIYAALFWLAIMVMPGIFAGIFTANQDLVSYASWALRIYMSGIFAIGFQIACQQSFMALSQAKVSLLLACLRKIILLIPLIFILPHFFADKVFAVFLAEPVSDILAASVTTITFRLRFPKILEEGAVKAK